jgi:adenylyltransferase/sulfurtransferase
MLGPEEIERYARHLVLREVGGPGQAKLKDARVLVIGAGGLGAPLLLYLAAAGVGRIAVIDDDRVALSNLQRQVIFGTPDIGKPKVEGAAEMVARLNPHVRIEAIDGRLRAANALDLIGRHDIVADGSDNFATRFLVNDACFFAKKVLVSAAVTEFDGQLATYKAFDRSGAYPCYRCLFAGPPDAAPNCSQTGVLGAAAGVMGSLQALEVLKEIAGIGQGLAGKLLIYEALGARFRTVKIAPDAACPLCGPNPGIRNLADN